MAQALTSIACTPPFRKKVREVAAAKGKKMYQICDELLPTLEKLTKHPTKGTQQHAGQSEN